MEYNGTKKMELSSGNADNDVDIFWKEEESRLITRSVHYPRLQAWIWLTFTAFLVTTTASSFFSHVSNTIIMPL